jgi:hypothetical protein
MSEETINSVSEQFTALCKSVDEVLSTWSGNTNLQFPILLGMIAVKLSWTEKQARENDPIIRYYIRNNPDWHVTRGAHGGIMKSEDKHKKDALKLAKDAVKKQVQDMLDAKVAQIMAAPPSTESLLNEDDFDFEEDSEEELAS